MDSEKIGNLIKQIRKDHNMTQQDFANKYGVTYQAVSKWENGKNLPDIMLLKEICNDFNVSIDSFLDGNKSKRFGLKNIIIIIVLLLLFSIGLYFIFLHNDSIKTKPLSSMCDEFKITGSIAYNKNTSSIIIHDINYCGKQDDNVYKSIECTLYEKNDKGDIEIAKCGSRKTDVTLDEYLNDINILVDDYNQTCRNIDDYALYLEINATLKENKKVNYTIPLSLTDSCKK